MKNLILCGVLCLFACVAQAEIKSVSVFAGSDEVMDKRYQKQAFQFGQLLAQNKKTLVYSGTSNGVGGAVFKGALSKQGTIEAVTTRKRFKDECTLEKECANLSPFFVYSISSQLEHILNGGDILVFMPGDFETLEAFGMFNTMAKQENKPLKPMIFLNLNHYWDRFKEQITEMRKQDVLPKDIFEYVIFTEKPKDVLDLGKKAQDYLEEKQRQELKKIIHKQNSAL